MLTLYCPGWEYLNILINATALAGGMGLTAYVDYLYSTYLVVQIRLSYDNSICLVIDND